VSVPEVKPVQLSTAVRRVRQQFSLLTFLYIVPPCLADVANVDSALCRQLMNEHYYYLSVSYNDINAASKNERLSQTY